MRTHASRIQRRTRGENVAWVEIVRLNALGTQRETRAPGRTRWLALLAHPVDAELEALGRIIVVPEETHLVVE